MNQALQEQDLLGKNVIQKKLIGNLEITCAGMPKSCYNYVNWDNFRTGLTTPRKINIFSCKRWGYFKRN